MNSFLLMPVSYKMKLGCSISERLYTSEDSSSDILHSGRSHIERSFFIQIFKQIQHNMNISLKYIFTSRETDSNLEWYQSNLVQDFDIDALKSFKENQVLIKFTYDMDVDLFY